MRSAASEVCGVRRPSLSSDDWRLFEHKCGNWDSGKRRDRRRRRHINTDEHAHVNAHAATRRCAYEVCSSARTLFGTLADCMNAHTRTHARTGALKHTSFGIKAARLLESVRLSQTRLNFRSRRTVYIESLRCSASRCRSTERPPSERAWCDAASIADAAVDEQLRLIGYVAVVRVSNSPVADSLM